MNLKTSIFQRSKYYGSPTPATKLKVILNMADPISVRHSDSTLKQRLSLTMLLELCLF